MACVETYYWNPDKTEDTARIEAIWRERVEATSAFKAFHVAIDPKSGKHNGLRGEPMEPFDPRAGALILVPVDKV